MFIISDRKQQKAWRTTSMHKSKRDQLFLMISIVCVVNDPLVFDANLLTSLSRQDTEFELVRMENDKGQFGSIPQALNEGGLRSHGEYVMFVHQDVGLIGNSWLKQAEGFCRQLEGGAFGVASVSRNGDYLGFIVDRGEFWGAPLKGPVETFTIDECLVIVPRDLFMSTKFDERFLFHSYVADLNLRLKKQGLGVFVIPCPIYHNSATTPIMEAGNIAIDDALLYKKHSAAFPILRKTTGAPFSGAPQHDILSHPKFRLLNFTFLPRFFKTNSRILAEFSLGDSLLDLGVIPREQQWIKQAKVSYSVGVSFRKEYLLASKRAHVHNDYVLSYLGKLPFRAGAFTIVMLRGILEYTDKNEGKIILDNSLMIGGKKILAIVPNNGSPSDVAYQYYASAWKPCDFRALGFKTSGLHMRIDIKFGATRMMPFLKPFLARLFPDLFARDILCLKCVH